MSGTNENNDTGHDPVNQLYAASPVNSDEDSATNWTVSEDLSHEEGFLSEESDLEDQFPSISTLLFVVHILAIY